MNHATLARAVELAAHDGEFRLAARFWTGPLRVVDGQHAHVLRLEDGQITDVAFDQPSDVSLDGEVIVAGPTEGWSEMLRPVPRPHYHDLLGAMRHGFVLGGDPIRRAQYHAALQRFVALLRAAEQERT